jgi:hypothetical protein
MYTARKVHSIDCLPALFLAAAIAYLLGGPIAAASTALAYAFDWRVVILRTGLGYGLAVVVGILMGRSFAGFSAIKDNGATPENSASGANDPRDFSQSHFL